MWNVVVFSESDEWQQMQSRYHKIISETQDFQFNLMNIKIRNNRPFKFETRENETFLFQSARDFIPYHALHNSYHMEELSRLLEKGNAATVLPTVILILYPIEKKP